MCWMPGGCDKSSVPLSVLNPVPLALVGLLRHKPQLSFLLAPDAEGAICDNLGGLCAGGCLSWDSPHRPCCSLGQHRVAANEAQGKRSSLQLYGKNFFLLSKFPSLLPTWQHPADVALV